ncbi:MAG: hypothetical protein K2I93_08415, partial [Oscillospiraceae bacterium]|nr:hypothetical protein [Oscillospiraceae bacterium]
VLEKTFEYLNSATKTYETLLISQSTKDITYKVIMAQQSSNVFEKSQSIKEELQKLVRVYLKTEWTRVKAESSIIKIKYSFCWKRFKGFQADRAIEKFLKEYKD